LGTPQPARTDSVDSVAVRLSQSLHQLELPPSPAAAPRVALTNIISGYLEDRADQPLEIKPIVNVDLERLALHVTWKAVSQPIYNLLPNPGGIGWQAKIVRL
jgi:hypothetical protein